MTDVTGVLLAAANDIETFGWVPRGAAYDSEADPFGTYPRCIWIAAVRAFERAKPYLPELSLNEIEHFIARALNVTYLEAVFTLNDTQQEENGKAWATETLRRAARLADARSAERDQVTDSTESLGPGSITNVENPLRRLLRKLHRVR